MLHHAVQYARDHDMDAEAGFVPKDVRWLVVFNKQGVFVDTIAQSDSSKKGNKGRTFPKVPHLKFSGDTPMRQFLVDNAQYVLLYDMEKLSEKDQKKLPKKHEYFLQLLRDAGDHDQRFAMIADALCDDAVRQEIVDSLAGKDKPAKPSDNITFAVIDDNGDTQILVEQTFWHDWWRDHWPTLFVSNKKKKTKPSKVPCLLSGTMTEAALTHPKIKGLGGVGGNVETTLVSFNADAFCSFQLEQSNNAAVSDDAAQQYAAALNELINEHSVTMAGTKVIHWYTGTTEIEKQDDPIELLTDADKALEDIDFGDAEIKEEPDTPSPASNRRIESQAQARARDLLNAVRTGKRPDLAASRFCALTLSGNSGRVVVRDWMEGQFEELAANIAAWFDDLAIVARDGDGLAPAPKFASILAATVRDLGDVPAPLTTRMWHVALDNLAIPSEVMAKTLSRVRIDITKDDPFNHARMGILKAFCIRKGDTHMQPGLNQDHPEVAYHCGRLLSVLAYIQYKALGDVGAGVVQRYYAAASATPALVLGRLIRTAQFHLDKIEDTRTRMGLDKRLAEIWAKIKDTVPGTLTLEQQTLFALGYYHQKAYRGPETPEENTPEQS